MNRPEMTVRRHLAYISIGDSVVAWNRYYPSLLHFKKEDFPEILDLIERPTTISEYDDGLVEILRRNHLLAEEDFAARYEREMAAVLPAFSERGRTQLERYEPFATIQLFNTRCNFNCSYCAVSHTWGSVAAPRKKGHLYEGEILRNAKRLLDRQYEAMREHGMGPFIFSASGGEFLLHKEVFRELIQYIRGHHHDDKTKITINTNGTLLDEETARFFIANDVDIYLSIDGPPQHHNLTRVYHNGRGSYDDVIGTLQMLKRLGYDKNSIRSVQGTLEHFDHFDPRELFRMSQLGLRLIRFSANVMGGIAETEGAFRANRLYSLVRRSQKRKLKVCDQIFDVFHASVEKGVDFCYSLFCNGLGGAERMLLLYNVSDNSLSYLCQYSVPAMVPVEGEIDGYHPQIFAAACRFIGERIAAVRRHCLDCPILGVCRGGCIISGLGSANTENPAACSYNLTLWRRYVTDILRGARKKRLQGDFQPAEPVPASGESAAGAQLAR